MSANSTISPRRHERGTALLLYPTAVLVLMLLGALVVDESGMFLAKRRLFHQASAMADDAATLLDPQALHLAGRRQIDAEAVHRFLLSRLTESPLPGTLVGEPLVRIDAPAQSLELHLAVRVEHTFGRSLPGIEAETIEVTVRGELHDEEGST